MEWGRLLHSLSEHTLTRHPGLCKTQGLGLRSSPGKVGHVGCAGGVLSLGREGGKHTPLAGVLSKDCKGQGSWGVHCVPPEGIWWEPAETTESRGQSCGLSRAPPSSCQRHSPIHHLLSTGGLREQPRRSRPWPESPPPRSFLAPHLVVCGVQGCLVAEVDMCVSLPHSWPWTTESSSWRPVRRPTSMWRM